MRFFLVSLLAVAWLGCSDDDVRAPDMAAREDASTSAPLRVLTWNVENLFDEVDDPDKEDDLPSTFAVARKLEDIGTVLRQVNADFVALQEVENLEILDRLADEVADLGYTQTGLVDSFDGRGIDVAFMTRLPLAASPSTTSHLGERFPLPDGSREIYYSRDALEVFLDVGGQTVGVVIVHFRSQLGGGGDDIRFAEARYTAQIAEARIEAGIPRMLVVGDMNDTPESPPLDVLLSGSLTDSTRRVPDDDRWTFIFDRVRQQLDYILASPAMDAMTSEVVILHNGDIDAASDHQPVAADFVVR